MDDNFIVVGKVINTHGIKGELKVFPLTDNINRFKKLKKVFIEENEQLIEYNILSCKLNDKIVILKFKEIDDINVALKYKNCLIKIDMKDVEELEEDSYYIFDLIGMSVQTEDNRYLGEIVDILTSGANDVYIVKNDNKELLLPAIKQVIKHVDIQNKKMTVNLIEGLEEL